LYIAVLCYLNKFRFIFLLVTDTICFVKHNVTLFIVGIT